MPLPLESCPRKPNYKLSNLESKSSVNIEFYIDPALMIQNLVLLISFLTGNIQVEGAYKSGGSFRRSLNFKYLRELENKGSGILINQYKAREGR